MDFKDIELDTLKNISAEDKLKNLLAKIHRDGGHHTEEVGLAKSVQDAMDKVNRQRTSLRTLKDLATRQHYTCPDGWYNCGLENNIDDNLPEECTCGVDIHNEKVEAAFKASGIENIPENPAVDMVAQKEKALINHLPTIIDIAALEKTTYKNGVTSYTANGQPLFLIGPMETDVQETEDLIKVTFTQTIKEIK